VKVGESFTLDSAFYRRITLLQCEPAARRLHSRALVRVACENATNEFWMWEHALSHEVPLIVSEMRTNAAMFEFFPPTPICCPVGR
jgi:hypothetical protein